MRIITPKQEELIKRLNTLAEGNLELVQQALMSGDTLEKTIQFILDKRQGISKSHPLPHSHK